MSTRELIDAIEAGNSLAIQKSFEATMAERIAERLDGLRQQVASSMFRESVDETEESESIDEAAMTAADKKTAHEVHKVLKAGESVGQAYGMAVKSKHNDLKRKYGSDWRKKAGIQEEAELALEDFTVDYEGKRGSIQLKKNNIKLYNEDVNESNESLEDNV